MNRYQAQRERERLLGEWYQAIMEKAIRGGFAKTPIGASHAVIVPGPRAGIIELIPAGPEDAMELLYKALRANHCANLRGTLPAGWDPPHGQIMVYFWGRYLRIEAPWPLRLADMNIRLNDKRVRPLVLRAILEQGGTWAVGLDAYGQLVLAQFNDVTTHALICGTTGSGKSTAIWNMVRQLIQDPSTRLVLLDGKGGAELGPWAASPRLIGPVAEDLDGVRDALAWCHAEMTRRNEAIKSLRVAGEPYEHVRIPRIVVVWDEPRAALEDSHVARMATALLQLGRSARIHLCLAFQHPTVEALGELGSLAKQLFTLRIAFYVPDSNGARVAVGAATQMGVLPQHLGGRGDGYRVGPDGATRFQGFLVDDDDLRDIDRGEPEMKGWPAFDAPVVKTPDTWPTSDELSVSLTHALKRENGEHRGGLPGFKDALAQATGRDGGTGRGHERLANIMQIGRDVVASMTGDGWKFVPPYTPEDE